jgi:hypothetical protein
MQIRPRITFEEYLATYQAMRAVKPKSNRRSWRYYTFLLISCLVFGVAVESPPTRIPALSAFGGMLLLVVIRLATVRHSQAKCMRGVFAEEEFALNDNVLTIDDSGISCTRGNGLVGSHYRWAALIYFIEMPDALLFMPTPNSFVRVPKQDLSASDDQKIREWSAVIPRKSPD